MEISPGGISIRNLILGIAVENYTGKLYMDPSWGAECIWWTEGGQICDSRGSGGNGSGIHEKIYLRLLRFCFSVFTFTFSFSSSHLGQRVDRSLAGEVAEMGRGYPVNRTRPPFSLSCFHFHFSNIRWTDFLTNVQSGLKTNSSTNSFWVIHEKCFEKNKNLLVIRRHITYT